MLTDEEMIIIYAVRYALGRMSYAVSEVAKYVAVRKDTLSDQCKRIIIRDIREELQRYHSAGMVLGMEIDERTWESLVEVLNLHL